MSTDAPTRSHPLVSVMTKSGRIAQVCFEAEGVLLARFEDGISPSEFRLLESEDTPGEYQVKFAGEPLMSIWLTWHLIWEAF